MSQGHAAGRHQQDPVLRQQYHFRPRKIVDYLKRFHALSIAAPPSTASCSGTSCTGCPQIRSIDRMAHGGTASRSASLNTGCRWT